MGVTREGVVYERFFTNLPQDAFTVCDGVELYEAAGAFEPILSDEDKEQDPDRWCSHSVMLDKKSGSASPNGCGTSTWNWGIRF